MVGGFLPSVALNRRFWIESRAIQNLAIRIVLFESCDSKVALNIDRMRFGWRFWIDFPAILLYCDSTLLSASRCGISGDSRPAIISKSCYSQEPGKGGFSKGGFCRVQCHAEGSQKYPRMLGAQQYIWHSERHSQERRTCLQNPHFRKQKKKLSLGSWDAPFMLLISMGSFARMFFSRTLLSWPFLSHSGQFYPSRFSNTSLGRTLWLALCGPDFQPQTPSPTRPATLSNHP